MRPAACRLLLPVATFLAWSTATSADPGREDRRLADLALDLLLEGQVRVMRVADLIRVAGADFCGDEVGPVFGAYAVDRFSFPDLFSNQDFAEPFIEAVTERFDLDRRPRVVAVLPGSPADRAGLRAGDRVTKIGGKKVRRRVPLDGLSGSAKDGPLRLTVEREAGETELLVEAELGCALPARFFYGTSVNAFATRWGELTGIYVLSGMLHFLPSDDDLALVVGHEFAHLILTHTGMARTSRRYEAEADYLGLYLAARAGFDVSEAADLWDRMARKNPFATIDWGVYRHPTSPARALALALALEEIADKRRRGEPLEPEGW